MRLTNSLPTPPKEDKPEQSDNSGFDFMLNEVEHDIEEANAAQEIIDRVPELKRLNEDIERATTAVINARLQFESAIQQYQRAEAKLGDTVSTICGKVDTINDHIDKVLYDAPTKLKVTVSVSDADNQRIKELFDEEHRWMIGKMQEYFFEVSSMFSRESEMVQKRYKEYDGCYFGYYVQWFFLFFYYIEIFVVVGLIAMLVGNATGWF